MIDNNVVDIEPSMVSIKGRAKEIRDARKSCGLSQDKAAAYCGVSGVTFQRWEFGSTKSIKRENYEKLCDILNGTVAIENA